MLENVSQQAGNIHVRAEGFYQDLCRFKSAAVSLAFSVAVVAALAGDSRTVTGFPANGFRTGGVALDFFQELCFRASSVLLDLSDAKIITTPKILDDAKNPHK